MHSDALPKTHKGRQRRAQILEIAEREFATSGAHKVSLASIAAEVGISEQGVMHYFPTKEHLLISVLEEHEKREVAVYGPIIDSADTPLNGWLAAVQHRLEHEATIATLVTVLSGESIQPTHVGNRWLASYNDRKRAGTALLLRQARDIGELRTGLDIDALALQITALVDGLILQWALDPQGVDVHGAIAAFVANIRA